MASAHSMLLAIFLVTILSSTQITAKLSYSISKSYLDSSSSSGTSSGISLGKLKIIEEGDTNQAYI